MDVNLNNSKIEEKKKWEVKSTVEIEDYNKTKECILCPT